MLLSDIPMDFLPKEALAKIPAGSMRYLMLINPTILLLIAVVLGTVSYRKAGFRAPLIERLAGDASTPFSAINWLKYGVIGGLISGLAIIGIEYLFHDHLPQAYLDLGEKMKLAPLTRFLYGGITEEILMRFGAMSCIAWLTSLVFKEVKAWMYWTAIVISAIFFALLHLPILFLTVGTPSTELITFIILGNLSAGLVFGWLYWKKGLETAMLAHIMAHVAMLLLSNL